jgi:hypothetical protein
MQKSARLLILLFACCRTSMIFAQNDSTWLDLGTVKLKKDFTQTISIKGEDLEKMPFTELSDAIDSWLYGAYSNPASLFYVVDGSLLADVNTYSIFDIEEIVFIQNALVQVNGATGQQQLVLITTRKHRSGQSGLKLAGQSGLVNRDYGQLYPGTKGSSYTNAWHQYYAGGYMGGKNTALGLSVDYQRDAIPYERDPGAHSITPDKMDRLRLNGYFDIRLGKKNQVFIGINYSPQQIDSAKSYNLYGTPYYGDTHQHMHSFSPRISWHSEFLPGLSNDLQVAYISSRGMPIQQ